MGSPQSAPAPVQTTVQKQEIDPALREQLTFGLEQARSQFEQPRQFYQGSTVVGLDPATEAALLQREQIGMQGSPLTQQTQDAISRNLQPLQGKEFQDLVNQQLRGTVPQIESEFARAGRFGSGLAQQAVGREVAGATADVLNQDRMRQLEAAQLAPIGSQLKLQDIANLEAVGGIREGQAGLQLQEDIQRQQFKEQERRDALNQFLAQIHGTNLGGTTTSTVTGSPLTRNRNMGLLGGALAGSGLFGTEASALQQGLGALGGGILGFL